MNEPIVSIGEIARRALDTFLRGDDENPYPEGSEAARMWDAQFQWLKGMKREAA